MLILGLESSCDETAAAIIDGEGNILSSKVLSQLEEHRPYGGVVPEVAARAHLEYIDGIIIEALKEAKITLDDIDAVAATAGPGLIGGVIVGVMTAKAIALAKNIPFLAVNHLEGHALTARMTGKVEFPYLLLLASGGHCQFIAVGGIGKYEIIGATVDDAAGEAFDKVAKMLKLPYPGGPSVEKAALNGNAKRFSFPRPMRGKEGCDLSFSGLKTAVRHLVESISEDRTIANANLSEQDVCDIAAGFQLAVCDTLSLRLKNAIKMFKERYPNGNLLAVAGGVAANKALREALEKAAQKSKMQFYAPPMAYCTDNAAMIAWVGLERFNLGMVDGLDFKPRPRWPLSGEIDKHKQQKDKRA